MLEILNEMLCIPTTSGAEDKMIEYITSKIANAFDECTTDGFGNLILHKSGSGKHILLCAGLDDYGVIASRVEGGNINIAPLGALSGKNIVNRVCRFFDGTEALITSPNGGCEPNVSDCIAFSGVYGDEKSSVQPGHKGVFDTKPTQLKGGILSGFGISSRVGAAVILQALLDGKFPCDCDLTVIFYAQSKRDDRGLSMSASACIQKYGCFDLAVAVCAHEAADGCKEDEGLALRLISKRYVCERDAVEQIKAYFESNNLKLQYLSDNDSDSPAQALSNLYTGILCAELCVPVKNIGTFAEYIKL